MRGTGSATDLSKSIYSLKQQQQDGQALQWASEEMKGDRELCMAAVAQNGLALKWASEEMKGDRGLCTAAVAQDGRGVPSRAHNRPRWKRLLVVHRTPLFENLI